MKRMMSIAAIALFMAGTSVLACDSCGCAAKKADKKAECSACDKGKKDAKKCGADCKKECCSKKSECKKADAAK